MKAIKNISEITLAIEGARGPPMLKKRNLFYAALLNAIILTKIQRSKMSHPQTIKAGFKAPPHDAANGRGPPIIKRENLFFRSSTQAAIISYNLYGTANDRKRVEERLYMPPRYYQSAINFYRPCWNAHERGPPVKEKEKT